MQSHFIDVPKFRVIEERDDLLPSSWYLLAFFGGKSVMGRVLGFHQFTSSSNDKQDCAVLCPLNADYQRDHRAYHYYQSEQVCHGRIQVLIRHAWRGIR